MSQNLEKAPAVEETEFGGPPAAQRRKVIHFANGDTLEQDSSEEEEEEENARKEPFSAPNSKVLTSWRERSWHLCVMTGIKFLKTCDFIGEKLANLVGLNMAKYQYAIDQFNRDKTQGSKCRAVDGARHTEEGTETIQLSSKKSAEYGATKSPQAPGPRASPDGSEPSQRPAGSQNQGYQED